MACVPLRAASQAPLTVRGTVTRETLNGTRAVSRELVTLHRVNSRDAGAVDSILTDTKGAFSFRVAAPDSMSMYLASARYGGIAYFSQPMQGGQSSGPAEIIVYDTTSRDVRVQLQGRHVVVSSPNAAGRRSVIDVLEIENDTILTRVPGPENRPTYSLLLPDGVTNVHASQGEISDKTVEMRNGRAELFSPLSPGLRQLVLTYEVGADAFPLAIPLEHSVSVLEVLLEERGASATGVGLADKGPVTVDGKTFTRYLGASANDNGVVTIASGTGAGGAAVPTWLLPLVLTVITLGAILVMARRRAPASALGAPARRARTRTAAASTAIETGDGASGASPPAAGVPLATPNGDDTVTRLAKQLAAVDALLERTRVVEHGDGRNAKANETVSPPASNGEGTTSPAPARAQSRRELTDYRARLKHALTSALAQRPPDR